MRWFEGSIGSAIQECKTKKAIFVVFIESLDEKGAQMDELWSEVDEIVLNTQLIAVHLKEGDEASKQFAQIYPTPIVPASYLIDLIGKPIEIITMLENMDNDKFKGKVLKAVQLFETQAVQVAAANVLPTTPFVPTAVDAMGDSTHEVSIPTSELTTDQKLARAKALLEAKKKRDEKESENEEKRKELERIESGKKMQEAQRLRHEKELLEAAAERRRQKLENEKEKERVKAQIKADREEREIRLKRGTTQAVNTLKKEREEAVLLPSVNSERCRLQLKFPDGRSVIEDFSSKDVLQAVVNKIRNDALVEGDFGLSQMYPKRDFLESDMTTSLLDLHLTPSNTLLIIQKKSTSIVTASPLGGLYALFTFLILNPFQHAYTFVTGYFNRTADQVPNQQPSTSNRSPSYPRSRGATADAAIRRREVGNNVRGLGNTSGDSEEDKDREASWNGNSTQFL